VDVRPAAYPVTGRVRVRRPLSLPRALREPVPARPPREVQGLGPGAGLVARESGRVDARLSARLLGHLEGPGDEAAALLAVSPVRPAGVGLLRDVAPDLVAQPDRERQPDPQGALPAPAGAACER